MYEIKGALMHYLVVCVLMHEVASSLSVQPGGRFARISHAVDPMPSKQLNPPGGAQHPGLLHQ